MSVMDKRRSYLWEEESTTTATNRTETYLAKRASSADKSVVRHRRRFGRRAQYPVAIGNYTLYFPETISDSPSPMFGPSKRAADVVIAASLLLFLLPVLAIVALVIYLEDGGSIFYYQTRVGRHGRPFRFYKYRSMVRNADAIKAQLASQNEANGPIFKMKDDPRITRVGKFLRRYSIDELPQLVNVLRGDMSLIGPRPHLPVEVARYTDHQRRRLEAQPGLLCFREVFGRSDVSFEQWIDLDLLYIQHRSFQTDMRILLRLVPAILSAEGAY